MDVCEECGEVHYAPDVEVDDADRVESCQVLQSAVQAIGEIMMNRLWKGKRPFTQAAI